MRRRHPVFFITLISILLLLLSGCFQTQVDDLLLAVIYAPENSDWMPYSAFAIGKAPFDYSPLDDEESSESEEEYQDSEDDYIELISMLSPSYQGPYPEASVNEGIGTLWEDVTIGDDAVNIYSESYFLIDAVCFHETEHVYYYVDTEYELESTESIIRIADLFEAEYGKIREIFGSEGDVDGNGHIRFVFTDIGDDVLGYYEAYDKYGREYLEANGIEYRSNESDVIFLTTQVLDEDSDYTDDDILATLCHEFSHMVFNNERARLDLAYEGYLFNIEGLAMWLEYYLGYSDMHEGYVFPYLAASYRTSVFSEGDEIYGMGLLFFRYVEERYGIEAIRSLVHSEYTGIDAVEDVIGEPFEDIFTDFATCILSTAAGEECADPDYYLPSLNDEEAGGFSLHDEFYYAFTTANEELNLDNGNVVAWLEPYTVGFFTKTGLELPDFECDDLRYIATDWTNQNLLQAE